MSKPRRAQLVDRMGGCGVAILPSMPVALRNGDVEHDYRQSSDLYYLTGFDEPDAAAVISSMPEATAFTLFCRPRDPEREIWEGPRAGVEGAVSLFGADKAFEISKLGEELPGLLANVRRIHYRLGLDRSFDDVVLRSIDRVRAKARLGITAPSEIIDPSVLLHEMRLRKSEDELSLMRRAVELTRKGHQRAREIARPGSWEFEIEGELRRVFRAEGAERVAFAPIVASGPNATILHYRRNDRRIEDGDLVLVDAGAEYCYYAADVTRTFPVSGKFTRPQRDIYALALEAQLAAIDAVRPGATIDGIHQVAVRTITEGLRRLRLLDGTVEQLISEESFKTYYPHRTSHWLGMDVHDGGAYYVAGQSRTLEPGMVITVEPGVYVSPAIQGAPPRYAGIGVRIEDDLLVTANGHEVLTRYIPKAIEDLEA